MTTWSFWLGGPLLRTLLPFSKTCLCELTALGNAIPLLKDAINRRAATKVFALPGFGLEWSHTVPTRTHRTALTMAIKHTYYTGTEKPLLSFIKTLTSLLNRLCCLFLTLFLHLPLGFHFLHQKFQTWSILQDYFLSLPGSSGTGATSLQPPISYLIWYI